MLMYHNTILFTIWVVALLSFQISLIEFVFRRQDFWCITKLFCLKFDLLLFRAPILGKKCEGFFFIENFWENHVFLHFWIRLFEFHRFLEDCPQDNPPRVYTTYVRTRGMSTLSWKPLQKSTLGQSVSLILVSSSNFDVSYDRGLLRKNCTQKF